MAREAYPGTHPWISNTRLDKQRFPNPRYDPIGNWAQQPISFGGAFSTNGISSIGGFQPGPCQPEDRELFMEGVRVNILCTQLYYLWFIWVLDEGVFCLWFVAIVATYRLTLCWMCDSSRTGCARRITPIYMWHEQAIIER